MPPTTRIVSAADGTRFELALPDEASEPLTAGLLLGHLAPSLNGLLDLLKTVAPPGSAVLDVGAHLGSFCVPAAVLGYRVLAVEGSAENAALLRESAALNGVEELLRVEHAAAGAAPGEVRFHADGPFGHVIQGASGGEAVPLVRVADLAAERGVQDVRFVKVDVEGYELDALDGLRPLLEPDDAPALYVESNRHTLASFGCDPLDLQRRLAGFGYTLVLVDELGLATLDPDGFQPSTLADILAVKGDPAVLGLSVAPELTVDGQAARVATTATTANPDERMGIARALAGAPARLVLHPQVLRSLAGLRADDVERVRDAAAWSAPLGEADAARAETAAARAELQRLLETRAMRLASQLWGLRDRALRRSR